ncbi:hypothetical protein BS78_09G062000 [Paspalum vaginatum]|nr:hypothetical protein BS78_09G062000 [Paspalum vaginatum]
MPHGRLLVGLSSTAGFGSSIISTRQRRQGFHREALRWPPMFAHQSPTPPLRRTSSSALPCGDLLLICPHFSRFSPTTCASMAAYITGDREALAQPGSAF